MIENPAQILGSLSEVVDALTEQERACGRHPPLPPHLFEVSQYAAITLRDWELPSTLSVAVLLSPLLAHHFSSEVSDGNWVNIADVLKRVQQKEERLLPEILRSTIKGLERQGILALRFIDQKEQICIPT